MIVFGFGIWILGPLEEPRSEGIVSGSWMMLELKLTYDIPTHIHVLLESEIFHQPWFFASSPCRSLPLREARKCLLAFPPIDRFLVLLNQIFSSSGGFLCHLFAVKAPNQHKPIFIEKSQVLISDNRVGKVASFDAGGLEFSCVF